MTTKELLASIASSLVRIAIALEQQNDKTAGPVPLKVCGKKSTQLHAT